MTGSGWLALRTLSGPSWVRGSGPAVLKRLRDAAVVRPGFLSAAEEETLCREVEPELRRRRYELDHWDAQVLGGHGLPCQVAAHSVLSHLHIPEEPSGDRGGGFSSSLSSLLSLCSSTPLGPSSCWMTLGLPSSSSSELL
ncbi:alkB-like protein 7 [Phyllostomus discolor]|uniref:AlkB-like protein 7 n=1 Tax=Phyllostomus discolor TaxID=89673 RepID=A0A833ZIN6_9CHIR|nr:alkB-like protein 7 [Phyllostomus discolor]